ncbi:TolC family outer membrane protein [Aerophototrophica crusticola]|uniref:Protein CyaE n=1 Tax=Aerophototrophica crusticola TaxID=1709002 RepID=A0A858R681_9PROT|nr:TolC family outer membrane protein [Rhodospirillaceae bacterium B3]
MDAMSLKPTLRRMVRATLPLAALAVGLGLSPARAQSLQDALAQAYTGNPTLEAARAQLRATDELVPQARSGYLPTLNAEADISRSWVDQKGGDTAVVARTSKSVGLTASQPIYRGGRTGAGVNRAENVVQAQRASLLSTEQSVLLDAATAYFDVVQNQAVLDLNVNNEQVLRRQLEASNDRFRVGEITRTDVSQSEARLAGATSSRIQAEGLLNASRATFARLVGIVPQKLSQPAPTFTLPSTMDETIALAEANNPAVVAAKYSEKASDAAVDVVTGELLPTVSLNAQAGRDWGSSSAGAGRRDVPVDSAAITARVTIPLYEAGNTTSRVREAKQTARQRRIEVDEAARQSRENAIRAWEGLVTARATIKSRQAQVRSSEIALEGVRQEATVGSRTVLDVLDQEQELLDARVNLVRAQRDELVAAFQVLAATGQLTASRLGLPVQAYDYEAYYKESRNKLWGVSID